MSRKRNTFSKAVKHLKSSKIEEKLQTLNEIPTMNTSGIYDVVPGALSRTEIDKNNPMRVQRAWEVLRSTGRSLNSWHQETPKPTLDLNMCKTLSANIRWI